MKAFVLDCSISSSWCLADETNDKADLVLQRLLDSEAVVPTIWPLEMANVLAVAERRKRISLADAARAVEILRGLPIKIEPADPALLDRTWKLAREHAISSYDAAYLDLAQRYRFPLATFDKALRAATRRAGVKLIPR